MYSGHESNSDPADFGRQLVFQVEPESNKQEANLVHSCQHDQNPVRNLERNESTQDRGDDQRQEAVAVDPHRLNNVDVPVRAAFLRVLVSWLGSVQVKHQLHEEGQTDTDAVNYARGNWDCLE